MMVGSSIGEYLEWPLWLINTSGLRITGAQIGGWYSSSRHLYYNLSTSCRRFQYSRLESEPQLTDTCFGCLKKVNLKNLKDKNLIYNFKLGKEASMLVRWLIMFNLLRYFFYSLIVYLVLSLSQKSNFQRKDYQKPVAAAVH